MDDWQYSFPELEGTATVKMVVDGEEITIEINGDDAPVTASNFADLVERDFYNGLMFHRVEEGFVAQGGDPQGRDPDVPAEELGSGGFIDPETDEERNIPLEIKPEGAEEPIYSQTFEDAEITDPPELPHIEGAIAMARTNDPDTASSQFYLALNDLPLLDGTYAVFGNVTEGMDVVEEIEIGDRIDYAVIVDGDIKSRSSSLISDSEKLNQLVNASNNAKVSLLADMLDEDEEDEEDDLVGEDAEDDLVGDSGEELLPAVPGEPQLRVASQESAAEEEEPEEEEPEETDTSAEEEPEETDTASADSGIEDAEEEDSDIADDTDNIIEMKSIESSSGATMAFDGDDEVYGTDDDDIINGNEGDDTIFGLKGDDWLRGGKGDDSLIGGKGEDYLVGDLDSDTLTGGEGDDIFILRADTAEGVQDVVDADWIIDWQEGEGIAIVGEFDPVEDFSFELVGEDTVIKLGASDDILGVVQNTAIASVEENIFVVAPDDVALGIG